MTSAGTLECADLATDDPRWASGLPVLRELRPHLTPELLHSILIAPNPPTFTAVMAPDGACVAIAGWRVVTTTTNPSGRRLFVDDLVTAGAHRGRGLGSELLDVVAGRGRRAGCAVLELDSGVQRTAAHRFHLNRGLEITGHHFAGPLSGQG